MSMFFSFNFHKKAASKLSQEGMTGTPTTGTPAQSDPQPAPEGASGPENGEASKRVHNLIILDESGSMHSIYDQALTGVNETLQTIRQAQEEHRDQIHFVSLAAFNTGCYKIIYRHTQSEKTTDITKKQYQPGGCTPLYDAMGRSINELRRHVAPGDVVLVTVITDGYENASQEYNGKAIKSLVEAMKKEGWIFTYIGANQDVEAVAAAMSIDNHLAFESRPESTREMFAKENRSRNMLFHKLSMNCPLSELGKGYFDVDDEDENKDKRKG